MSANVVAPPQSTRRAVGPLVLGLLAIALAAAAEVAAAQEASAGDPATVVEESRARAAELLLQLAALERADGLLAEAEDTLRRALAMEPEPEAAFALGQLLASRGAVDEADAVFASLLDWSGGRAELHVAVGGAYADAGLPGVAIREFEAAIAADPTLASAHVSLAYAHLTLTAGQSSPAAERALRRALALDAGSYEANYALGQIELLDGRRAEAAKHLLAAAAARPRAPDPWLLLGLDAFAHGETGEAESRLRRGVELADGQPAADQAAGSDGLLRRATAALSRIALAHGDRHAAARWFERYRRLGSPSPPAAPKPAPPPAADRRRALAARLAAVYNDWGTAEARRGDYAEALRRYREAEGLVPDLPGLARNLGLAAFHGGDYAESARALTRAVEVDPADRTARALLAISLASSDRFAEAAETFAAIGDSVYADPRLAYLWALSLTRSGRPEEARRVLGRMRELALSPEALIRIADVYEEAGDPGTAAELRAEAARRSAPPAAGGNGQ